MTNAKLLWLLCFLALTMPFWTELLFLCLLLGCLVLLLGETHFTETVTTMASLLALELLLELTGFDLQRYEGTSSEPFRKP